MGTAGAMEVLTVRIRWLLSVLAIVPVIPNTPIGLRTYTGRTQELTRLGIGTIFLLAILISTYIGV